MHAALAAFLADGRVIRIRYGSAVQGDAEVHLAQVDRHYRVMDALRAEVCAIAAKHGYEYLDWDSGGPAFDGEVVYLRRVT
jgi:hypothetical protein